MLWQAFGNNGDWAKQLEFYLDCWLLAADERIAPHKPRDP